MLQTNGLPPKYKFKTQEKAPLRTQKQTHKKMEKAQPNSQIREGVEMFKNS